MQEQYQEKGEDEEKNNKNYAVHAVITVSVADAPTAAPIPAPSVNADSKIEKSVHKIVTDTDKGADEILPQVVENKVEEVEVKNSPVE